MPSAAATFMFIVSLAAMTGCSSRNNNLGGARKPVGSDSGGSGSVPRYRVFSIGHSIRSPDGTVVYPFLNPKDVTSGLPWNLIDGFSLAAGDIQAGTHSKIHVMPVVTQVTYVVSGHLCARMRDQASGPPYTVSVSPGQAILTKPGDFLQLINIESYDCHVLYLVSPAYLFDVDPAGVIRYDDSIVLEEDWDELQRTGWAPPALAGLPTAKERRRQAYERLAAIAK